jgi:hypothetical protein
MTSSDSSSSTISTTRATMHEPQKIEPVEELPEEGQQARHTNDEAEPSIESLISVCSLLPPRAAAAALLRVKGAVSVPRNSIIGNNIQSAIDHVPGDTYQEKLNHLRLCNCCERHQYQKPHLFMPWRETRGGLWSDEQKTCECDCRHVARFICRQATEPTCTIIDSPPSSPTYGSPLDVAP